MYYLKNLHFTSTFGTGMHMKSKNVMKNSTAIFLKLWYFSDVRSWLSVLSIR